MLRKRVMMGKAEPPEPPAPSEPMRKIHVKSAYESSPITMWTDSEVYREGEINIEVPFDAFSRLRMYNPTGSDAIREYLYVDVLDLRGLDVQEFFRNQSSMSHILSFEGYMQKGFDKIILEDGMNLTRFFYYCSNLYLDLSAWAYKDIIMTEMFYEVRRRDILIPNLLPKVGYNHGKVFSSNDYYQNRIIDISGWNREHAESIDWLYGRGYTTFRCKQEVADVILSAGQVSGDTPSFEIVG